MTEPTPPMPMTIAFAIKNRGLPLAKTLVQPRQAGKRDAYLFLILFSFGSITART